jgi:hypothetical protein
VRGDGEERLAEIPDSGFFVKRKQTKRDAYMFNRYATSNQNDEHFLFSPFSSFPNMHTFVRIEQMV